MNGGHGDEKRGRIGRCLRAVLAPAFYWLDWYGQDGRPSHSKIMYTVAILVALAGVIRFGMLEAARPGGISLYFVIYTFGVLAAAAGIKHLTYLARLKFGGLSDAAGAHEGERASQIRASAEYQKARASIEERRQLGREDGIEPAP